MKQKAILNVLNHENPDKVRLQSEIDYWGPPMLLAVNSKFRWWTGYTDIGDATYTEYMIVGIDYDYVGKLSLTTNIYLRELRRR